MKKYLIPTSILLATISAVSAYEVAGTAAGTVSVNGGDVVYTASAKAMPAGEAGTVTLTAVPGAMPTNVRTGTAVAMRAMPLTAAAHIGVMTTGDATVDAKIRAIEEERMTKIKAINVEYDAKVKAAIGNLKPKAYTTTSAQVEARGVPAQAGTVTVSSDGTINTEVTNGHMMTIEAHAAMEDQKPAAGITRFFWSLFH